jgi:hypothetical protein
LFLIWLAALLATVALPQTVAAQNYTFTNIVDDTGPFGGIGFGPPKLNNAGGISFQASLDGGGSGIYRSDGVDITTIADNTGPYSFFRRFTDINDAGQVAFAAHSSPSGLVAIFRGGDLTITKIAEESGSFTFENFYTRPRINNIGQVTFVVDSNDYPFIDVGSGGNLTTYAYTCGTCGLLNIYPPSINNQGDVAFSGLSNVPSIFRSNGGTISTLIDNTGPYDAFSQFIAINDNGVVAAVANLDEGGQAIIRIDGSTVDVIAGPPDAVLNGAVGLNNAGDVSFIAALSPTVHAILTGPDPVADKVIAEGDTLFGSTITSNYFSFDSIDGPNDAGQIVFGYELVDGRSGIALATPVADPMCIGDYNGDGKVSAADYTVWRDSVGAATLMNRDPENVGPVGGDDFNSWMAHYGEPVGGTGSAIAASAAVPEPATIQFLAVAVMILCMKKRIHHCESVS